MDSNLTQYFNMKSLYTIIDESLEQDMKLSSEDKKYLLKLDDEYDKLSEPFWREVTHFQNIVDVHSNIVEFKKSYKEDKPYTPHLKYEESKFKSDEYTKKFVKKCNDLINKFMEFPQCYLSHLYIQEIRKIRGLGEFYNKFTHDPTIVDGWYFRRPSKKTYEEALKMYKEHPFKNPKDLAKGDKDYEKNQKAPDCISIMQKEIDKQGYAWKAECDDNLIPRMSVKTYNKFVIRTSREFSKVDLNSLMVHEINTHVRRKHLGNQTGLKLFLYGVGHADDLDEGMALRNSLEKLDKQKPNILFYVSQKIIINYWIGRKTFTEIFDFLKKITPNYDEDQLLYALHRNHRCTFYSTERDLSYNFDTAYFEGYQVVKDLSEAECEWLMHYNIGIAAMHEIPNIKKFFKVNKFDPVK